MADHAESTPLLPGLTTERVKAIAALVVNLASTVSAGLALAGLNPLPFTSDEISAAVLATITVISAVYNWWTHLTVTKAGYEGKMLTAAIKNASLKPVVSDASQVKAATDTVDTLSSLYAKTTDGDTITDSVTGTPIIEVK